MTDYLTDRRALIARATGLPWRPDKEVKWGAIVADVVTTGGVPIEEYVGEYSAPDNTALIVAAVNEYGRLLDAASALGYMLEVCEQPPESRCTCHIAPPCNDCVEHAAMRDAIAAARAALAALEQA